VVVDSTHVYWASLYFAGVIGKVPIGGGSTTILATDQDYSYGLAVDPTSVYWTAGNSGEVRKIPLGGGTVVALSSNHYGIQGIAVDPTKVYWTRSSGLWAAQLDGGSAVELSNTSEGNSEGPLALGDAHAYWAAQFNGKIFAAVLDGGMGPPALVAANQVRPFDLAVDNVSRFVYWTDRGAGTVMRAPVIGGPPFGVEVVARAAFPQGIALDESWVYWSDPNEGSIRRIAK
jgi:hypothetical protein